MAARSLLLTALAFSLTSTTFVQSEIFTALSHVERLVNIEMELSDALEDYIFEQEARLKKLRSFFEDVKVAMDQAKYNRDNYIGHPMNTYLMIKRLVNEWKPHVKSIQEEGDSEGLLIDKFENYRKNFPGQDDLEGAMAAIKRLQEVYNLKPHDFTRGKYGVMTDSGSLISAMDAFKFGRGAFVSDDMENTQQWMAESLKLLDLEPYDQREQPNRFSVLDHLAWSSYKLGDVGSAINYTIEALKVVPNHERSQVNLGNFKKYQKLTEEDQPKKPEEEERKFSYMATKIPQARLKDFDWFEERRIFKKLCRGDPMPHAPQTPQRLRCFYKTGHPLCTIKRCPIEVVFTNPDIMILHQIMTNAEIDKVIRISKPLLNRATVHNPTTGKLEYAQYRISKKGVVINPRDPRDFGVATMLEDRSKGANNKYFVYVIKHVDSDVHVQTTTCWLNGGHDELIERVNRRMTALTGLNLQTAEDFQVQNYGLAGHYDPHFDFSRDLETSSLGRLGTGNRIATVLLYMSDVEAGGATVFPYVGARVKPRKGDAVFWHNLLRSGEGDFRTRHAGCPVLKGWKWVSNKWIHEYGNEFHRPCAMSPEV